MIDYQSKDERIEELEAELREAQMQVSQDASAINELQAEVERLKADLDRVTRGTYSLELARLSKVNTDLRFEVGQLQQSLRNIAHRSADLHEAVTEAHAALEEA